MRVPEPVSLYTTVNTYCEAEKFFGREKRRCMLREIDGCLRVTVRYGGVTGVASAAAHAARRHASYHSSFGGVRKIHEEEFLSPVGLDGKVLTPPSA